MNITIKTAKEIELMRKGGKILKNVLETLAESAKIGMSTRELDRKAETMILAKKAFPSFKGYQGFPSAICASINEEVVHGIPGERILKSGDVLKIDCGVFFQGFHTDKALTVIIGESSPEKEHLVNITKKSLEIASSQIMPGNPLGKVSHSIQRYVESEGLNVVRDLVGHGIGREIHEDPPVPNFGPKSAKPILKSGMTIAIEPMVVTGEHYVVIDGWNVKTADKSLAAHFENTFLVTDSGFEILT